MADGAEITLPRNLEDWSYKTIVDIVGKYEFEPGIFDYKAVLNATNRAHRNDHNDTIRRTASSMANADGGYILFGVRDRKLSVSSPEERIVGIPLGGDLRKSFADKLDSAGEFLFLINKTLNNILTYLRIFLLTGHVKDIDHLK